MKRFIPILAAAAIVLGLMFTPSLAVAQSCGSKYTVVAGDTMFAIAQRCGVTLTNLANANKNVTNIRLIYVGQVLNIPGTGDSGGVPVTGGPYTKYTVKPGDYMRSIASQKGVTLAALMAANPTVANFNLIYPGQVLNVPPGVPVTGGGTVNKYTVKPGDTLAYIAQIKKTSVPAIMAKNPEITNINQIYVGQLLIMP